jgi:sugar lactone lactonase YvrE
MQVLSEQRSILGESPLWHHAEQVFYWVDIVGRHVFRYDPGRAREEVVLSGETVTSLSELSAGGLMLVTPQRLCTLRQGETTTVVDVSLPDGVRTNDGKCDPRGRLWFGTMDLETSSPLGELFVFDGESIRRVLDRLILSNGLGWSPSGDILYHVDSIKRHLYRHRYDGDTGAIEGREVLVDMTGGPEVPDGLAVDVAGNVWVAMYDGWRIDVYDPSGRHIHREELDVQRPTSVAFGGEGLSDLYVTTASQELTADELDHQPNAGLLLRLAPGIEGLPVAAFAVGIES